MTPTLSDAVVVTVTVCPVCGLAGLWETETVGAVVSVAFGGGLGGIGVVEPPRYCAQT